MTKKILALLMAVLLALGSLSAFAAIDEKLAEAISELNMYLTYYQDEKTIKEYPLDKITEKFASLGNAAKGFYHYANILLLLERGDYRVASKYKKMLENNTDFSEQLNDKEFKEKYAAIKGVQELLYYVDARIAENNGDTAEAETNYMLSGGFFDSAERLVALGGGSSDEIYGRATGLFMDGKYEDAYLLFYELAKFNYDDSVDMLEICGEILIDKGIDPKQLIKGSAAQEDSTQNDTAEEPTPTKKPAPTNKPTPTSKPADKKSGHWSSWSTEKPSGNAKTETKTQYRSRNIATQYRYRTLKQQTTRNQELKGADLVSSSIEYGSWSAWSDNKVSKTDTRDVETRKVDVTEQVKQYSYSRFRYINTQKNWNSAPVDPRESNLLNNYLRSGEWQYTTVDSPKKAVSSWKGYTIYESNSSNAWWNEKITYKTVVTGSKTQYRYRSITLVRVYEVWSEWSEWQNKSVSASSTRKVETRKNYGEWSKWSDNAVTSSSAKQVETRTVYRYWIAD
ncbi:MAG: hypothetical protein K5663_12295 [Clostridiales bacterium]|nr:hypothetical protein [Clostridiales bacterium]